MPRGRCLYPRLVSPLTLALAAAAVTVDTVEDIVDFAGSQQVTDLPGPDGKGLLSGGDPGAPPGPRLIAFAIPTSEWWMFADRAIRKLEQDAFVVTDDETFFDFSTQADFTGDTNPNGGPRAPCNQVTEQ